MKYIAFALITVMLLSVSVALLNAEIYKSEVVAMVCLHTSLGSCIAAALVAVWLLADGIF